MRKLLHDFIVEDCFDYGSEIILKEAERIAETEVRNRGYSGAWTVGQSRDVEEMEGGVKRYYFEVYGEAQTRALLIDDLRNIKADVVARTYDDGIRALQFMGPFDILYLDHDYGDPDPAKTGYGIMCWLEEHPEFLPGSIFLVTSNPVGLAKMQVVIDRLYNRPQT